MRQPTAFWPDLIPTPQKELVSGKHSQKSMAREVTGISREATTADLTQEAVHC